jgi:fused signal recognition particle receptor
MINVVYCGVLMPKPDEARGLFTRLRKTRESLAANLSGLFRSGSAALDDAAFDDLVDQLILADLGVEASTQIVAALRRQAVSTRVETKEQLNAALKTQLLEILRPSVQPFDLPAVSAEPRVVVMVGVNGVGKTTTAAKLAHWFTQQDLKVMLGACDTYRAAAIEQLQVWGERLSLPVIAQQRGADAAAVAHDALSSAKARSVDVLIIDSAGRQHVNTELMDQLQKMNRVIQRLDDNAPHETLLVVDAATGQNALAQVSAFAASVRVTGLCVTKLDGTARGGVLVALAQKFQLPIYFVGVGESVNDLRPFDAEAFVTALIGGDG